MEIALQKQNNLQRILLLYMREKQRKLRQGDSVVVKERTYSKISKFKRQLTQTKLLKLKKQVTLERLKRKQKQRNSVI